jgi:hypothetical protein
MASGIPVPNGNRFQELRMQEITPDLFMLIDRLVDQYLPFIVWHDPRGRATYTSRDDYYD